MDSKTVVEMNIRKTLYVITSECSQNATETIEEKLERLICRRCSDGKSYQSNRDIPLAMCATKSEHGTDSIVRE